MARQQSKQRSKRSSGYALQVHIDELLEDLRKLIGPASKGSDEESVHDARVAKARRFRHGAMGDVAAALAACKVSDAARELVDEILAEAPALEADDRVCAFAAAAPALTLLGQRDQARDLVQRASKEDDDQY